MVVADAGLDGLVVRLAPRGVTHRSAAGGSRSTAAAGEPWDALVAAPSARSGRARVPVAASPGSSARRRSRTSAPTGKTSAETIRRARPGPPSGVVVDAAPDGVRLRLPRQRVQGREPDRFVVLAVTFALAPGGAPRSATPSSRARSRSRGAAPSLAEVRAAVLALRADEVDGHRRRRREPAQRRSFFTNPIVGERRTRPRVEAGAGAPAMPRWPERDGRVKLSAGWLIERAGFHRGETDGPVGLSTRHSLAVVAHAGASARDVVRFARRLRAASRRASASAWSPSPSSGASTAWRMAFPPTRSPADYGATGSVGTLAPRRPVRR